MEPVLAKVRAHGSLISASAAAYAPYIDDSPLLFFCPVHWLHGDPPTNAEPGVTANWHVWKEDLQRGKAWCHTQPEDGCDFVQLRVRDVEKRY